MEIKRLYACLFSVREILAVRCLKTVNLQLKELPLGVIMLEILLEVKVVEGCHMGQKSLG